MSSVKKNFIYNVAYQILLVIIPLITTPYVSRVLGTEGIGIYSYTYSIVYYFILFAMLGLNNYGNRQIARVRDKKEKLSRNFWEIYGMQIITSTIMILIYIIYVECLVKNNKTIARIQAIYLFATMFDINWFFFGLEKFKLTVTRNVIIKIAMVLNIFIFVNQKDDLYLYTLIMAIGSFISQIVLMSFLKKYVSYVKVNIKDIAKHIKPCLILFVPVIAVSLYKIMDKVMLGKMTNMQQVGLYENSEKTLNILTSVVTALGTVMLPKMSNLVANGEYKAEKRYIEASIEFTLIVSSAMSFGMMAIASSLVPIFFGNEFIGAINIIRCLSVTTLFIAIANVIRTQYIIPHKKDKSYIISVSIGAIVNLIMNIIFIPKYMAIGAAVATVMAEFVVMIYQIIDVKNEINILRYIKDGSGYILAGIIMLLIVSIIGKIINNIILRIILQVLIGAITYMVMAMAIFFKQHKIRKINDIKTLMNKIS